jgi:hypothetical protein
LAGIESIAVFGETHLHACSDELSSKPDSVCEHGDHSTGRLLSTSTFAFQEGGLQSPEMIGGQEVAIEGRPQPIHQNILIGSPAGPILRLRLAPQPLGFP